MVNLQARIVETKSIPRWTHPAVVCTWQEPSDLIPLDEDRTIQNPNVCLSACCQPKT